MMLTFNSLELMMLISSLFWPMVRVLSFLCTVPVFDNKLVNRKIKIILSIIISCLVSPFLPEVHISLFSFLGFFLLFEQILIGVFLGFTAQFLFVTINLAGEIMGLQMGLSFATFFNNGSHVGISIISRLLNILMFFFFLSVNGHLYLISILIDSFYSIPIDNYFFNTNIFFILLSFFSHVFLNSIIFILPIMIMLLSISFIMSLLNRLSPQISIFSIGFPLNLLVGILVLYSSTSIMFPFFQKLLNEYISFISHIF